MPSPETESEPADATLAAKQYNGSNFCSKLLWRGFNNSKTRNKGWVAEWFKAPVLKTHSSDLDKQ